MPYVVIDAGHGGYDNGAQYFGYKEKDITLRVAQKVASRLRNLGFEVKMLRDSDEYVGSASDRGRQVAALQPDYAISIHVNSGGGLGGEILVPLGVKDAQFPLMLKDELSKLNKFRRVYSRISGGEVVDREIDRDSKTFVQSYPNTRDYYGIIREAWAGGVTLDLIELFFLDNEGDLYTFLNQEDAYVEAIVKSLADRFDMAYYRSDNQTESDKTYYRVVCGAFYDLKEAKQLQRFLTQHVEDDIWIQEVN